MAAPLVTSRPIQNTHTALDLWVPEYQEIRGRMMTGHVEYQIVVVTTLPAFKSAKHKPEDVVQFVVSRKYSEIDEFYQKICANHPSVSLPPFPRKVLFVGESDIRERRAAFNDIVKAIAKDKQLATCPELLEFLGSSSSDFMDAKGGHVMQSEEGDFFKYDEPQEKDHLVDTCEKKEVEEEDEEEEVDLDPLGIMKTKKVKKPSKPKTTEDPKVKSKPTFSLFDDEVDPDSGLFEPNINASANTKKAFMASDDIKLFEEQDLGGTVKLGDSLLLPSACKNDPLFKPSSDEDVEELFRVEEDFEKLLNLGMKPKTKPKPKIPVKPTFLKGSNPSEAALHLPSKQREANVQAMDEIDILQYIKENEPSSSDPLSLF
ncbi:HCLS1-binding protein 3 [Rhinophrynus dorsalis]